MSVVRLSHTVFEQGMVFWVNGVVVSVAQHPQESQSARIDLSTGGAFRHFNIRHINRTHPFSAHSEFDSRIVWFIFYNSITLLSILFRKTQVPPNFEAVLNRNRLYYKYNFQLIINEKLSVVIHRAHFRC